MSTAVTIFKTATIAGIIGLLLWHASDVSKLATSLMQILTRAIGVANA